MKLRDLKTSTVKEIIDDSENRYAEEELYLKDDVDEFLEKLADDLHSAIDLIYQIQGIVQIDACKDILQELSSKIEE